MSTTTATTPLQAAFVQMLHAVARHGHPELWDAIEKLEEQVYPEHFVDTDDEYPEEYDVGCECEIDWKCGVCQRNGYRHSILDAAPKFFGSVPVGNYDPATYDFAEEPF